MGIEVHGRGHIRVERSASKVNSKTVIGTTKTHAARSVAVMDSLVAGRAQNVPTREAGQGENTPDLLILWWSCRESNP
jgi:hypothetical protein